MPCCTTHPTLRKKNPYLCYPTHHTPQHMALPYTDIALPGIPPYRLMHVPGGEFLMGANEQDEDALDREKPAHRVRLDDFYIGRFPVTQDLWASVMGENPAMVKGLRCPVENVSWNEITHKFLPRLNKLTGHKCRLPTESEWEYSTRSGTFIEEDCFRFASSDILEQVGWYDPNSGYAPREVGLLLPNALGLYDMSGNVWEWCADWYQRDYYSNCEKLGVVHNPLGPDEGSYRVLRGGSWASLIESCRVSSRNSNIPIHRRIDYSFRIALVP